ncbi:VWA domain-containing protein [Xanthomonas campestris pv. raphani]|uniref:VWA domain-containing protein n=1 Tax=Xanthomonas campestris TaxID=339 RepID=UPI002B22F683|nr:VWA domain-containing protein [Xanthomonas campestris]MEA9652647.1 VWA domain-containing protein [Xanthomonas campestris pv. raphani]MEA9753640.1 VWA domain-containing protein [Xanthomonas campestris pv. raphani]MEA9761721.1 VWA domain-containing protein [Xanthomonas campestris pv. raphani]MEA9813930.1 VWA domain-containing protein [Xanthomonas campestris pv. raphani]MEA9895140.1 VWA domain-containing protein [Xanthomonas campestris pv. raphani]
MAMNMLSTALNTLHLLRPQLLWALVLIVPAAVLWFLRQRDADVWRQSVDAHLLPQLLVTGGRRGWSGFVLAVVAYSVAVVAMSGPSWRQTERPVYQSNRPLVVALDLSSSINANDLPPSRLLQARAKLATLLRERAGGDVALLAYAGESFTVAPLTEDAANVALFLDALSPSVMPVDGKRADRAIEAAVQLLSQAGFKQGDILVMSDSADESAESAARVARSRGFNVSTLGVGSARGAAYRAASGEIAQARLDEASLRDLASQGGGRYAPLAADDADLRALGVLDPAQQPAADAAAAANGSKTWLDEGYWLLFPVMALALLAFRRRAAVMVLALLCVGPFVEPAQAAEGTLWQRADQVQQQRLDAGVQAYRKGDFAAAQKAFEAVPTDQGWYNLGNALARQGRYDDAIAAYDRALRQQPQLQDAIANRAAVDAARKRQQQNKDGKGKPQQNQNKGDKQQDQNKDGQGKPEQTAGKDGQDGKGGKDGKGGQDGKPSSQPPKDGQTPGQPSPAGQGEQKQPDSPPQTPDAQAQQQADAAQRRKMEQAMAQAGAKGAPSKEQQAAAAAVAETPEQREQRQAVDAWIRRVPDDPGSLLRAKFRLEHERRQRDGQ